MKLYCLLPLLAVLLFPGFARAQFVDEFESDAVEGWFFFTGDGDATMDFVQRDGYARMLLDATEDEHNVWWAIIKRAVSDELDLSELTEPGKELRVEARVRVSEAPRRLNIMINTQRTTDFHEHLMEYDIPDTSGWHTISLTTKDLDVVPGDTLYVQLGATDWGLDTHHVDVDYYRADVVDARTAGPDIGEPLRYHPPVPDLATFAHALPATHDALVNARFPNVNFNDWRVETQDGAAPALSVGADQWAVLRWDFDSQAGAEADGAAILELTTHSVMTGGNYAATFGEDLGMEFGKVRVIEILGGDPVWTQDEVTYYSLLVGESLEDVVNGQMIFDVAPTEQRGGKTRVTISRPVMQRLLDGRTKGLLIRPLGAIDATFYASEAGNGRAPRLFFNVASE